MIRLRPGSVPWLLQHELRLHWRELRKQSGSRAMVIVLLVLMHLFAIPLALAQQDGRMFSSRAAWLTGALIFALLTMISRTLVLAVQALHARGDMDLLLSSPLSPKSVVAVRMATIAVSATFEFGFFVLPFANVFLLFGLFGWLRAYLLLPALGILAATISLFVALQFSTWLGPRRTRVAAQILSAFIGVIFVLGLQLPNILRRDKPGAGALRSWLSDFASSAQEVLRAPGEWLLSGPFPSLLFLAACVAFAAVSARSLGRRFVAASVATAGVSAAKPKANAKQRSFRRHAGRIIMSKELRLIVRDPWLITQILQQTVFVLPIGLALWRTSASGLPLIWMLIIMVAGVTASTLTWITVNAEDAPELIRSAPIAAHTVLRYKLQAVGALIAPLIVLPILVLWRQHLWFALCVAVCGAGSALTSSLMYAFDTRTGNKRDFRTRHKGSMGRSFVVLFMILAWYGVCALLIWLSPFEQG